ncbi:metallophosphoesterase family protein [Elongatibacter sediminis]|uniref:Metallophosphoesterase n=1 Tax=Elongatibacter sediminis TaxID=3119006 RepID=A0AAW9RGH3_9GAMM
MTRLIHLTDLHLSSLDGIGARKLVGKRWTSFLSWRRRRRHIHRRDVLDRLAEAVRAERPDLLLITGDLVQIGLDSEIREAAAWLAALAAPEDVFLVPGNHDVYARDSWPALRRHWAPWLPAEHNRARSGYPLVRDIGGLRLIGASSACVTPIFSARGALGGAQRRRLDAAWQQAAESNLPTALAVHHPPVPGITRWRKALRDNKAVSRRIKTFRPAFTVCGHLHRNLQQQCGNTPVFVTASASSIHDASYRVIDFEPADGELRLSMQLKSLDPAADGFTRTDSHQWVSMT